MMSSKVYFIKAVEVRIHRSFPSSNFPVVRWLSLMRNYNTIRKYKYSDIFRNI